MTEHDDDTIQVHGPQFAIVPVWLYDATIEDADGTTRRLPLPAVALYGVLAGRYANRAGVAYPTHAQLASDLAATDRSVRRWLDDLELVGALTRRKGRAGKATVYTLSPRTVAEQAPRANVRRTPVSGVTDTSVRAARTPVSDQPEDPITRQRSDRPARASGAGVPALTIVDRPDGARWYPGVGDISPVPPADPPKVEPSDAGRATIAETRARLREGTKKRHPTGRDAS